MNITNKLGENDFERWHFRVVNENVYLEYYQKFIFGLNGSFTCNTIDVGEPNFPMPDFDLEQALRDQLKIWVTPYDPYLPEDIRNNPKLYPNYPYKKNV